MGLRTFEPKEALTSSFLDYLLTFRAMRGIIMLLTIAVLDLVFWRSRIACRERREIVGRGAVDKLDLTANRDLEY